MLTSYEIISLFLGLAAIIIALYSLNQAIKSQSETRDLQLITADLHRKQLYIMNKQELEKGRAWITVSLHQISKGYSFLISNSGKSSGHNISISLDGDYSDDPFNTRDYRRLIPIEMLEPGDIINLKASIGLGSYGKYPLLIKWRNEDGTHEEHKTTVSI